jgi:hypothetical protein
MTHAAMAAPIGTPSASTATAMISLVAGLSTGSSSSAMAGSTMARHAFRFGSSALILHAPSTSALHPQRNVNIEYGGAAAGRNQRMRIEFQQENPAGAGQLMTGASPSRAAHAQIRGEGVR